MVMKDFQSISGIIIAIDNLLTANEEMSCYKLISVQKTDGEIANFVAAPETYFVGHVMVRLGDMITGFYDANAPVPLIYPPQYKAVVMVRAVTYQNVKVDYFDENLVSSDGMLKLNPAPTTQILLQNGQVFTGNPANRYLVVVYGPTTRSVPAQAIPEQIVALC
jgi:hypothetical protein